MPKMLNMLNLAGFGMKAWDQKSESPAIPFSYSADWLPVFDKNLKSLAEKVYTNCLLAHVRGVPSTTEAAVSVNNNHPFCFPNCKIALAHNGDLTRFMDMKGLLVPYIDERILGQILLLSQLQDPTDYIHADELKQAVEAVFRIIRDIRIKCNIDTCSSANLFISDGQQVSAIRYCFDFGRYPVDSPESVQYTLGREYGFYDGEWQTVGGSDTSDTVIIASEPLTNDISKWLEVPEYSMLCANTGEGNPRISLNYLDV
jgi:glutamine amidotransferase